MMSQHMIQITSLESTSVAELHAAFNKAFADYAEPFNKTQQELKNMLSRRGYRPDLSFGAFHNNELVSFILNGIGQWNGEWTVYDTGTGTIKDFRRQGLVKKIFQQSVPILQQKDIRQYLLEVIKVNTKAFELYKKEGFNVVRELDYYISSKDKLQFKPGKADKNWLVKEIDTPDWELFKTFREFNPSWQNSIEAMNRGTGRFKILGIYRMLELAGYAIIEPETGDIPQFAIAKPFRRKGMGTTLLRAVAEYSDAGAIKFINSDAAYGPFREFMKSVGLTPGHGQYEMMLKLQ
jgi:ribosomal protein S18 acetylase RimI-like enzyme